MKREKNVSGEGAIWLLPFRGTARKIFCHSVAEFCQVVEITTLNDISPKTRKATRNALRTLQNLALCSELRYVCGLSDPKGRHFIWLTQKSYRDRASDPAAESPRHGGQIVLALAFTLLSTPALSDVWHKGSSFDGKAQSSGWKRSSFMETSFEVKPASPPVVRKVSVPKQPFLLDPALTPIGNLRNLISSAESGHLDYDAVAYGAPVQPPQPPTLLTIGQIRDWVATTPGQNHAVGRYQFIPATFERLATQTKIPDVALFTPDLQDRWANILILEAGYPKFVAGALAPDTFMDNVASIWAGLPLASGKSAYDGINGNHATLARQTYAENIALIFQAQIAFALASAQQSGPK